MYLLRAPQSFDPKINLATEEFLVRNFSEDNDLLFIYRNNPSVIIGKNQNPFEEINLNFLETEKIEMYRRISGGGAVYHDRGNINFSYFTTKTRENFNNYRNFLQPIISLLNKRGVPAGINTRNDIVVNSLKISGNAQFTTRGKMFSHGTLLFNADLNKVNQSLDVHKSKIESKSTKSVRSRIMNIADQLDESCTIDYFLQELVNFITNSFSFSGHIDLDINKQDQINTLAREKYGSWEWNWGRTPGFVIQVLNPYSDKTIDLKIENCKINTKDLNPVDSFSKLLYSMNGVRYRKHDIKQAIGRSVEISTWDKQLLLEKIYPAP